MDSVLKEYIQKYRSLITRRCKLDAKIDFMEDLIRGYAVEDVVSAKVQYFNHDGELLREENF